MTTTKAHCETMANMVASKQRPAGFRFDNIYRFMLGTAMMMPTPAVLADRLGMARECYRNATNTALRNRKKERFVYCEGFAIPDGLFPMEHAWLFDTKLWRVVETTWNKPGVEYFGIAFTRDYLKSTTLRRKYYGLINNWNHDFPLLRMPPTKLAKVLHPAMKTL